MSRGHYEKEQAEVQPHSHYEMVLIFLGIFATIFLLAWMILQPGIQTPPVCAKSIRYEKVDDFLQRQLCVPAVGPDAGEATRPAKTVYTLNDADVVAPKPRQECYGTARDPFELGPVLHRAEGLLDGQETLFSTSVDLQEESEITYYLDDSIFAVAWKQVIDDCIYTFSEVKIAHPSQFRRFLADNRYGSAAQYTTTEMSATVNAVVASSGDYYGYRSIGIVVDKGEVLRGRGHYLDTCYIDENGDLLFTHAGDITDLQTAQSFVEDHHVRFSLSFGPIMIMDGECCVPPKYNSGEINKRYARAALCQLDKLHYLVVTANLEKPHYNVPTVKEFGTRLQEMGIPTAYALDGGQTAAIAMNTRLVNCVSYGAQREISDILYFATALPEESEAEP